VTGEIKFKGNTLFPESELWQQLEMLPGLTYSQYYVAQDIEKLRSSIRAKAISKPALFPMSSWTARATR